MARLTAEGLGKRFGYRLLFRDLSFAVQGGETLAVTGANGSGKSTLLRILAGVLTPSMGHVGMHLDGGQVAGVDHPLHVGLVAPYLNVYEPFSPRENLRFIARARCLEDADTRIDAMLEFVALRDRADDLVGTFSSGMKQRVKFASALLAAPPLLLLDEPGVNLDAAGLTMVDQVVEKQRRLGGMLVVATNDPHEADRFDREISVEDYR